MEVTSMGKDNARYGDILTTNEACEYLQCSRPWLMAEVHAGRIPGMRVGARWRFSRDLLLAVVQGRSISRDAVQLPLPVGGGEWVVPARDRGEE